MTVAAAAVVRSVVMDMKRMERLGLGVVRWMFDVDAVREWENWKRVVAGVVMLRKRKKGKGTIYGRLKRWSDSFAVVVVAF